MSSIVLDLQKEVLDPNCDILAALRKAHLIAYKLDLKEFDAWITGELNGYIGRNDGVPEYRVVTGKLKSFNPFYGWQTVCFNDSKLEKIVTTRNIGESIGGLIALENEKREYITMSIPAEMARDIDSCSQNPFPTDYAVFVGSHVIKSIIDSVVNRLLEWTLRLESEGILGENMQFTQAESTKAQVLSQMTNNYYGPVVNGNVQQSQLVSGNNNKLSFEYQAVSDLLEKVKSAMAENPLSDEDQETANELISDLEEKISKQKKPGIIKAALSGLKDFLIGAGGNVAGSLILEYLATL